MAISIFIFGTLKLSNKASAALVNAAPDFLVKGHFAFFCYVGWKPKRHCRIIWHGGRHATDPPMGHVYALPSRTACTLIECTLVAYPCGFQVSFSKPLCMDWAMDDSMRSTYLTTWGANTSLRWLWNLPPARFSVRKDNRTFRKQKETWVFS